MDVIARIDIDPRTARVYEHGWQSWSPTMTYAVTDTPYRPRDLRHRIIAFRPEVEAPRDAFQGEGLLAVDPGDGGVRVFAAPDPLTVPSITARQDGDTIVISADGPVDESLQAGGAGMGEALARWAEVFARGADVAPVTPAPTVWCSWYHYFTKVTEEDILENLDDIGEQDLPIDVIQVDDGYQSEVGDWLTLSDQFTSLPDLAGRIRDAGRRAGIWTAPFMAGVRSQVVADHPEWFIGGVETPSDAGHNWGQNLYGLDVTHPGAAEYLTTVFRTMRGWGIDYFKIDFLFSAALEGRRHEEDVSPIEAYRRGLDLIRDAIGDAYLLGCGAPILPSVGLVDAMRISPDTGPQYEPANGELDQASSRAAIVTGEARAFQHGRFWVNDADCLIVRPEVERREDWAQHVERFGGLRASSDRIAALDDWGMATTRRLLSEAPPALFVET